MKSDQLHDLWISPDNSRLVSKQFSFRLPVHIAAKIAALCEMYPQKNRTQIVADLLTSALETLESNLPEGLGEEVEPRWRAEIAAQIGANEPLYYLGGARGRFRNLANKYYRELENELGNENPEPLFENLVITQSDIGKK